jgi:predicted nucleic acid-binding protein
MPTVIDSSGWIEYFTDGPNCDFFEPAILNFSDLIVPSITITEVFRWVMRESSVADALSIAATMKQGKVVPLDDRLAILASELSHRHQLRLADGIIYATARYSKSELLSQDSDLEPLPGVRYVRHPKRSR